MPFSQLLYPQECHPEQSRRTSSMLATKNGLQRHFDHDSTGRIPGSGTPRFSYKGSFDCVSFAARTPPPLRMAVLSKVWSMNMHPHMSLSCCALLVFPCGRE